MEYHERKWVVNEAFIINYYMQKIYFIKFLLLTICNILVINEMADTRIWAEIKRRISPNYRLNKNINETETPSSNRLIKACPDSPIGLAVYRLNW